MLRVCVVALGGWRWVLNVCVVVLGGQVSVGLVRQLGTGQAQQSPPERQKRVLYSKRHAPRQAALVSKGPPTPGLPLRMDIG